MDKREEILDVATKLFAKNGFEKTPISAICTEANISKGLVFHHFKTKDELLREIFARITEIIGNSSKAYKQKTDPTQRLIAFIESIFSAMSVDEHKYIYQLNFNVMFQPSTRSLLQDLIEERTNILQTEVKEIFDFLGYKSSSIISRLFVAEVDGIALNYLFLGDDFDLPAVKQVFIEKYVKMAK
ncbi:TetR/AcrR family transcriptional regulator [Pseudoalteromonas phenolica]|uniref:TetR/AcrR family transcriptional regulator n=1 Tax=Pseudoalteromonas phenolica TaxID=161398 RepID=UPI0038505816